MHSNNIQINNLFLKKKQKNCLQKVSGLFKHKKPSLENQIRMSKWTAKEKKKKEKRKKKKRKKRKKEKRDK